MCAQSQKRNRSFLAFNTNYRIPRASTNAYYAERAKQKGEVDGIRGKRWSRGDPGWGRGGGGGIVCSGVLNRRTTALVIRIDGSSRFLNGRLLATSRAGDNEARQTDKLRHGCTRRCTGRR